MPEWKNICCAIDFSEPSRCAMETAADLANRLAAELTIVHVNEGGVVASGEMGLSPPELMEQATRELEPKVRTWMHRAEEVLGRPVRTKVLTGNAADEIHAFLRQGGFDLLVMGTHGRAGLAHFVVGSVAEEVQRRAEQPVLVVRVAKR